MPTYSYECPACNKTWDAIHSIAERHSETCESCQAPATLVLSTPQIATFGLKSPEEQAAALKRRSIEHTQRELKKNGIPEGRRR